MKKRKARETSRTSNTSKTGLKNYTVLAVTYICLTVLLLFILYTFT